MGRSVLQDTNVKDTVKDNHVQTTYFISDVTNKHLGNYTVHVVNTAIKNEPKEVIFNVLLKKIGNKSKAIPFFLFHSVKAYLFFCLHMSDKLAYKKILLWYIYGINICIPSLKHHKCISKIFKNLSQKATL